MVPRDEVLEGDFDLFMNRALELKALSREGDKLPSGRGDVSFPETEVTGGLSHGSDESALDPPR